MDEYKNHKYVYFCGYLNIAVLNMPVRRAADPCSAQNVWDAIRIANSQKQMADSIRISKYLQKVLQCSQAQAELYLKQTLQDELIIALQKITAKGSKAGNEVESYKIPHHDQDEIIRAGHDWYCIDCHLAGDVSLCVTCHRVFHAECAHKNQSLSKRNLLHNTINNGSFLDSGKSSESIFNITTTDDSQTASCSNSTLEMSANGHDLDCDRKSDAYISGIENDIQNGIEISSKVNFDDGYYDEAVCSICNMSRTDVELAVEEDELNYLLTFIYNRIRSWVPVDLSKVIEPEDQPPEWYNDKERKWRCEVLFYDDINMSIVEKKLEAKEYRQPSEFKADMLSIQHNIAVYHGTDTQEYKASEFLLKDCFYEISELYNCLDCYKHSNEKVDENWFCIPCRIPHKLVWAKQLGHPYWPAKVLRENERACDVRFFGAKYERALLSKLYIKPIAVNITSLNIKKKPGFNRALKELHHHQNLLKTLEEINVDNKHEEEDEPENDIKYISSSRKVKLSYRTYKPSKRQRRNSSGDNLSENDAVVKPIEQRNSSIALNITITKSRDNEYATRQTVQNRATRKRNSNVVPVVIAKCIETCETYPIEESSSMATNISPEELNGGDNIENEENHEEVTSSSETVKPLEENYNFPDVDNKMPNPERQYSESVEKTRRKLEECVEKDNLIKVALECMQAEIDKISNEHDTYIKRMFETQNNQISETKKKQWCYNCEQDAIYHCCWNTAYCSLTCQQQHWQTEHKKVCRRKR